MSGTRRQLKGASMLALKDDGGGDTHVHSDEGNGAIGFFPSSSSCVYCMRDCIDHLE